MKSQVNKKYDNILYFDLETTGLNFYKDKIIQFGAVMTTPKGDKQIDMLIDWGIEVPQFITELTGISNVDIEQRGVKPADAVKRIFKILQASDLVVGYNVLFDITFMVEAIKGFYSDFNIDNLECDYLDVLTVARDFKPVEKVGKKVISRHKLVEVCKYLKIELTNAHNALGDIVATKDVLDEISKLVDTTLYVNNFGYSSYWGVSPYFAIPSKINMYAQGDKGCKEVLEKIGGLYD